MSRPALLVLVWVLGVVLAMGTGLLAVRLVADRVGDQPQPVLSLKQVQERTSGSPAATTAPAVRTPSPVPSARPSTGASPVRPPTPTPAATRATASAPRTFAITGGTVSVRCGGRTAQLVYATPAQGWALDERSLSGPEAEVRFEDATRRSRIQVSCASGRPVETERRVDENGGGGGD